MFWLLARTALAADPVVVTPDPAGSTAVMVKASGVPVSVPACRGINWERFDPVAKKFVPIPGPTCGAMAPALRIDGEARRFELDGDARGADIVRAVVVVGLGCLADRPFPIAGCTDVLSVDGPQMSIRTGGGE